MPSRQSRHFGLMGRPPRAIAKPFFSLFILVYPCVLYTRIEPMPQSMSDLEKQRSAIVHQLNDLGDFRPGFITSTSGRCGKPNCRCHRPSQPPHGPTDRLTYKVGGKTVSESLSNPSAFAKVERKVAEFRNFQQLSQQFVEVNTQICALRPVAEAAPSDEGKNFPNHPPGSRPRSRESVDSRFP